MINLIPTITQKTKLSHLLLSLKDGKSIRVNDIVMIEGDSNYSCLYMADGRKICTAKTLKAYEDVLKDNTSFIRIHKGYLINLLYITDFDMRQSYEVHLQGGLRAEVSRRKKNYFTLQANHFIKTKNA